MADTSTSQTLRRGLKVLDLFQGDEARYRARELAEILEMSPTVTLRLLNTLVEGGYLAKDEKTGEYSLGLSAYVLGLYANPQPKLARTAMPFLKEIASETGETVSLNFFDIVKLEGVCIASIESEQVLKTSAPIGVSKPVFLGASRKVLLAFLSPLQQEQIFKKAKNEGFEKIDILKDELEVIKKLGFSNTEGEVNVGTLNVAVPVISQSGTLLASIAISCPTFRKTDTTVEYFSRLAKNAADQIVRIIDNPNAL
ncbi:IclR family transcriptional regulator [Salicibibacter cibarius]|uniref:IclR family transcriptional regulator n=1 Tax=Salicibibacter cibarius TaxID=2743000 RepID=A0A7T7CCZ4_9BACI|nr:IclR family transcriptional regulator [Salicibibacter cibarius]QQK77435.1 IclR family transcriptional regulator [Salicibibacter cibarius]